jgi:hypothetical protein
MIMSDSKSVVETRRQIRLKLRARKNLCRVTISPAGKPLCVRKEAGKTVYD